MGGYLPLAPGVSTVRFPIPQRTFEYVATVQRVTTRRANDGRWRCATGFMFAPVNGITPSGEPSKSSVLLTLRSPESLASCEARIRDNCSGQEADPTRVRGFPNCTEIYTALLTRARKQPLLLNAANKASRVPERLQRRSSGAFTSLTPSKLHERGT